MHALKRLLAVALLACAVPALAASTLVGFTDAGTIASGGSDFLVPLQSSSRWTYLFIPERLTYFDLRRGGVTLKNLTGYVSANNSDGVTTLRSRKNSGNGNMTISVANTDSNTFLTATNSDALVSTDTFDAMISTLSGVSLQLRSLVAELQTTSGPTACILGATYDSYQQTAGLTRYAPIVGDLGSAGTATETDNTVQFRAHASGFVKELQIGVETAITADTVFTLRKNEADTALTFTLNSGSTGTVVIDATDAVRFAASDRLDLKIVTGSGTGTLNLNRVSVLVESVDNQCDVAAGGVRAISGAGARADYFPILGNLVAPTLGTGTAEWRIKIPFGTTLGSLRVLLSGSASGGSTGTFTVRNTGSGTSLLVAVPSGSAAGWYESARTASATTISGDTVDVALTSPGTWNASIAMLAVTLNYDPNAGLGGVMSMVNE